MKKAFFNWSTGKDSALALFTILNDKNYSIQKLVTSVNKSFERVSMHGVQEELLNQQAKSIGLPLEKIYFPEEVSMDLYGEIMKKSMNQLVSEGYEYSVFGDIFLEDLKNYREQKLAEVNLKGVFPLWKRDSKALMTEFIKLGFKAITVSVNLNYLDETFVGRELDEDFINDLPENVDVCGENGEFHTFVYDGPIFKYPIEFVIGEKTKKEYSKDENTNWDTSFWYIDLIPKNIR
ncbi:diphthine--ammonia ligase [Lutibacter sp.]|uniref:Dph6-related ATP pyrophosphatase n=1 Tax=Lutibacter sp. TaxID=1925666 RepID=UPI001A27BC69|nr:diphthine--ammonia ligase [Lutibacter sp.]MBI9041268.1 diphthine--ammonia ligase [Lutibacter sp.]